MVTVMEREMPCLCGNVHLDLVLNFNNIAH